MKLSMCLDMSLRKDVREILTKRGILHKTIARDIGYSEAMVSLWLNDKVHSRNIETALRFWLQDKAEQDLAASLKDLLRRLQ